LLPKLAVLTGTTDREAMVYTDRLASVTRLTSFSLVHHSSTLDAPGMTWH
jgi:hypothetical protein